MLFFFNDTATTEIYTLSLHDALPISRLVAGAGQLDPLEVPLDLLRRRLLGDGDHVHGVDRQPVQPGPVRSEEHTSELQSRQYLVCRLLLEKKKTTPHTPSTRHLRSSP